MPRVIVAGGGPAGCAFAVSAAAAGHEVIVLDEGRRLRTWPGESLPAGGGELVVSVFGPEVLDGHAPAYGTVAAWGSDELVSHDFMAHWSGRGWHLDRERFDAQLRAIAMTRGADLVAARLTSVERTSNGWRVNGQWAADWVVDATGRAGAVGSRLGIRRVTYDEQVALLSIVPDLGGQRVTTVEAAECGWWYSTPLAGERRVVALITDPDLISTTRTDDWNSLVRRTHYIRAFVPDDLDTKVQAYPAGTSRRERVVGEGWLAVGDAAVSFDPLSSQGLITGIVMGARAGTRLGTGLAGWAADYDALLTEHEQARAELHGAEGRWAGAPFWRRRSH